GPGKQLQVALWGMVADYPDQPHLVLVPQAADPARQVVMCRCSSIGGGQYMQWQAMVHEGMFREQARATYVAQQVDGGQQQGGRLPAQAMHVVEIAGQEQGG